MLSLGMLSLLLATVGVSLNFSCAAQQQDEGFLVGFGVTVQCVVCFLRRSSLGGGGGKETVMDLGNSRLSVPAF